MPSDTRKKIELQIAGLVSPEDQSRFSHVVNAHGRTVCKALKPQCGECCIMNLCPFEPKTL